MTASELAFLALGLLLGTAAGAALSTVLGSRIPRREIKVTVTRDALPRRSETLSQDAFVTSPAEPARGGPGDRRSLDREADRRGSGNAPVPVMAPMRSRADMDLGPSDRPSRGPLDRTIVPSDPSASTGRPGGAPTISPPAAPSATPGASPGAAPAVPSSPGAPSSPRPGPSPFAAPVRGTIGIAIQPEPAERDGDVGELRRRRPRGSALERMLRGEHLAMVEAVDAIAGEDSHRRREWELLLGGLVEGMAEMATREAVIDFPMGTAFWDTFTVEQCRRIVVALASMGYHYDGGAGWVENRPPAYRDLAQALADVGIEPRRVRAWPNQSDIATLFAGARPAPEELLAAAGPDYLAEDVRLLLGDRADELADLWLAWDSVRPILLAEG